MHIRLGITLEFLIELYIRKNIRVKAANHQVNVELQSTIQGANDINKRVQAAQSTLNLEDIGNQVDKLRKDIVKYRLSNENDSLLIFLHL